jgi:hypothetical protein
MNNIHEEECHICGVKVTIGIRSAHAAYRSCQCGYIKWSVDATARRGFALTPRMGKITCAYSRGTTTTITSSTSAI